MANLPPVFTITADTTEIKFNYSSYGTNQNGDANLASDQYTMNISVNNSIFETFAYDSIPFSITWNSLTSTIPAPPFTSPNIGDSVSIKLAHIHPNYQFSNSVTTIVSSASGGVACFTSNSRLLTSSGYKSALDIQTGDLLMTADGRAAPVQAFTTSIVCNKETAPYLIPKHSLGHNVPTADLRLSPWHAIQLKKGLWMKPATAAKLGKGVQQYGLGDTVVYYHFEAPNYFTDNFICDGTVVESFANNQLANSKTRVYRYNSKLEAYTRAAKSILNHAT